MSEEEQRSEPPLLDEREDELEDETRTDSARSTQSRRWLAILATLAIVVVVLIAVFADGGDDPTPEDDGSAQQPTETSRASQQDGGEGDQGTGGVELGSLSVGAFGCPEMASPDTDCLEAGNVDLQSATLVLADGTTLGVDDATRMPDGSLAWLNVPIGSYTLLEEGLVGPPSLLLRNVIGAATPGEGGWTVSNPDPNQPAVVQILFAPDVGSPAAG